MTFRQFIAWRLGCFVRLVLDAIDRTFPPKREYKLYEGEIDPRSRNADTRIEPSGRKIE